MTARMPLRWPLAALAAFGGTAALVLGGWPPLTTLDVAASAAARGFGDGHPTAVGVLRVATALGSTVAFVAVGVAAAVVLAVRRARSAALFCVLVTIVVPLLWAVQHAALYRPRPAAGFVTVTSNGFPSGHSTNAAALAVAAVLLLWCRLERRGRLVAILLTIGFAASVGATRVLLVVHWPSDVLGGWLLAAGIVPLLARIAGRGDSPPKADLQGPAVPKAPSDGGGAAGPLTGGSAGDALRRR